jgi:hypothetical protein
MATDKLIFNPDFRFELSTNIFERVPIILKYEDINLIEVVREYRVGYTTEIPIYHPDGTFLTKIVGNRMRVNLLAKKAGVEIVQHPNLWVCTMNGKTLFEIRQKSPDFFKTTAELYANDGFFVKVDSSMTVNALQNNNPLVIGHCTMMGNTFTGMKIGIWAKKDGSIILGAN